MTHDEGRFTVYWPRSERQTQRKALARRPASLEGKTVGFLWDVLFRGDEVFAILEEGLRERFPNMRFLDWREFGNTHGSDEREVIGALPARLEALGVDAVVSAMAA